MSKKKSVLFTSKQYRQDLLQNIHGLYSVLSITSPLELTTREYGAIKVVQLELVNLIDVLELRLLKPLKAKLSKSSKSCKSSSALTTKKRRSRTGTHLTGVISTPTLKK